jgi:hypothetical protein
VREPTPEERLGRWLSRLADRGSVKDRALYVTLLVGLLLVIGFFMTPLGYSISAWLGQ